MLRFQLKVNSHLPKRRKRQRVLRPAKVNLRTELWYRMRLISLTKDCRNATESVLLPLLKRREADYAYVKDTLGDDLGAAFKAIAAELARLSGLAAVAAREVAQRVLRDADAQLRKSVLESVSIDVQPLMNNAAIKPALDLAVQTNVDLITSIPSKYLDSIKQVVYNGATRGQRYDSIVEDIQKVADVSESRAEFIARDQTAKMNSSFNEIRQQSIGIDRYVWSTSGDERVRESHAEKEGEIIRWDEPPSDTGHPGMDYNCRCVALPYFDLDSEE